MSSKAAKFAPFCVVAGTLGYLCWPYLDDPTPPAPTKPKAGAVELTAALLSPPAAPPLSRDPFGSDLASQKPAGAAADGKTDPADQTPASPENQEEPQPPETPALSVPSSLVLSGTYLRGNHRVAVINELVYAEGDQIVVKENAAANWSVSRVGIDRVMLEFGGEMAELSYPDLHAPKAASNSDPLPNATDSKTQPPVEKNSTKTTK
jgi:hypothetical protein